MLLYANLYRRFGPKLSGAEKQQVAQHAMESCLARVPSIPLAQDADLSTRTVLIVGAGLAGLSAAWWLKQFGVGKVIVLEARDRLGGRVHSLHDFSAGRIIEGGAELIGLNHPLWLYFAKRFDLGLSLVTPEDDFAGAGLEMPIFLDGALLTPAQAETLFAEMTLAFEQIVKEAEPVNGLQPWDSPYAAILDGISVADRIEQLEVSALTKRALQTQFENDNATATSNQSYLGLLAAVKGGGLMNYFTLSEVYRCERGNQSLASSLASALQGPDELLHGHPVTAIRIRSGRGAGKVVVTAAGKRFRGDFVVLAVPPSLWSRIKFTPALPRDLTPQLGPAIKYLSHVRDRFWLPKGLAPIGLSDQLGETWEGTDNQMAIPGQGAELTVFAGGPDADAALAAADPDRYFTERIGTLYPGYADAVFKRRFLPWPRSPWTMTGYSFPAPGQVTTLLPVLNRPFHKRLFFAGEHASPEFVGFMEGALQSGLAAALRLLAEQE